MKKQPISLDIYKFLFPSPGPKDPTSFEHFTSHFLVPEIRNEICEWYSCHSPAELETVYPGWDYCDYNVRVRLRRYKAHAKLFKAFDKLGLSEHEIDSVATWLGTKHELERYENENVSRAGRYADIVEEDDAEDDDHFDEEDDGEEDEGDEAEEAETRAVGVPTPARNRMVVNDASILGRRRIVMRFRARA